MTWTVRDIEKIIIDFKEELESENSRIAFIKKLYKMVIYFQELILQKKWNINSHCLMIDVGHFMDKFVVSGFDLSKRSRMELVEFQQFITKIKSDMKTLFMGPYEKFLKCKMVCLFEAPIERALKELEGEGLVETDILAMINRCPYTLCPVCEVREISREKTFIKFKRCMHLVCMPCMSERYNKFSKMDNM